jgi:uncharacterized protein
MPFPNKDFNQMRIFIDIGHPAHVHYFKNMIRILEGRGHQFFICARDKEITHQLLDVFKIPYISRGKGGLNLLTKLIYLFYGDFLLYKYARHFQPDLFVSFASTYAAHVSKLLGKTHIALDDTEHAKFELLLYPPFTDVILTPKSFTKELGPKQLKFNSFTELLYLHPNYFIPDAQVLKALGLDEGEDFALVRFVSWTASHDIVASGLTNVEKVELVAELSKRMKVFISSEDELPLELMQYEFSIHPQYLHDALYFARLYIGEGGTTASEAALLGTPAIYINSLSMGYIEEEIQWGLLHQCTELNQTLGAIEDVCDKHDKKHYQEKCVRLIQQKIDPTGYLISIIDSKNV